MALEAPDTASKVGTTGGGNVQAALDERPTVDVLAGPGGATTVGTAGGGTVQSRIDQIPSVKDAGAVGDGTTDDTAADAAARAALKDAGGGVLFYPPADGYLINGRRRDPGFLLEAANFPEFAGLEPNASVAVYTVQTGEGGSGKGGVYSFVYNGDGNHQPFNTIAPGDAVAVSAIVFSGTDVEYPVCASHVLSRYAGLPPGINWGIEIDMNNESSEAYTAGDARGGQALVINTGSTYSPDTGIVIQRAQGEGTGPGYKAGMRIVGARDYGIVFQAMAAATYPGMSPAAPGTLTIISSSVSNDANPRFSVSESGAMAWGDGTAAQDTFLSRSFGGGLVLDGPLTIDQLWIGGHNVVGPQQPAIANAASGTEIPTINAILAALRNHGLIDA